jgi:hypothetical protein
LADRDPKVRESMRPTFWAFARLWSERSEGWVCLLVKRISGWLPCQNFVLVGAEAAKVALGRPGQPKTS